MGDRPDPIPYKGKKFHFKGGKNVIQTLKKVSEDGLLSNRDEVVIAGSMNGGIPALMWADRIANMTNGKVSVLADAAVHLNRLNHKLNRTSIQIG